MKKPILILLTELLLSFYCFSQTEVFTTRVVKTGFNSAWEMVYGPHDSLWVTENKSYLVSRVDIASGNKTVLLDLSAVKDFPTTGQQPQGGLMGIALHPNLFSTSASVRGAKPWVYLVYVYHRVSASCPSDATSTSCNFNTRVVRYDYNGSTLSNPTIILDGLPGSSDHNSGRLVISPNVETGSNAAHTQYRLYYTIGDMGAGQLTNLTRTENAQNVDATEGKVLRLNTEADGDGGQDDWTPNDNPYYNAADLITAKDYVFTMGHRNPQGLAWGSISGSPVLYSSEQMDRADDEINIIQKGHNYGWDKVSGKVDGDVDGAKIGQTTVSSETTNASLITNNTEPIFTFFHQNATWSTYPTAGSSNGPWPTVALSSIDFYSQSVIPGWQRSLLLSPLKEDHFYRLKLNPLGTGISGDTISYVNGGGNRVRRVRISPDGTTIYVARDAGSGTNQGAIVEYKFLGYSNVANTSTIPSTVGVTTTTNNTVTAGSTITINAANKNMWVPITGPDGDVLAEIYPNGNVLGTVTSSFYITNAIRQDATGRRYLNRSFTITPTTQPTLPSGSPLVKIRLYLKGTEYDALNANSFSGVSDTTDLLIRKNSDASPVTLTNAATIVTPTFKKFGSDNIVLQANISSFSSFYIGSNSIILPVNLIDFKGSLQNTIAHLQWSTSSEANTANFSIERSSDGNNFTSIGIVTAKGNSVTTTSYEFADKDAANQSSSRIFYRLKINDKDGAYKYSEVINITLPFTTAKLSLFPNPATDEVNVAVAVPVDGNLQWKLMDNTGRVVIQNSTPLRKGNNNFSININKLSAGLYYLTVSGAGIEQKIKLQKL